MITKKRFEEIRFEVEKALMDTFKELSMKCPNEFALFLGYAEYIKEYEDIKEVSPYMIDYYRDKYKDETRMKFLVDFLNKYYSFGKKQSECNDYQRNLELMIYTHIWEAKIFYKNLYRLSYLVEKGEYKWIVKMPDTQKHKEIKKIKKRFESKKNPLKTIIEKGYHSSFRNAFAHSDYSFETMNGENKIILHNYGGKKWEISDISFNEWTERFVYSFLLNYKCYELIEKIRKNTNPSTIFRVNTEDDKFIQFRYDDKSDSFKSVKP